MKIKILNKENLIDNTITIQNGRYSLSNLKEYECVDGEVYKKNYNETLDDMVLKVSNQYEKIDIEPYDEILLNDEYQNKVLSILGSTKTYKMLVNNYHETMIGVNPRIYDYEINLFSKTKLLEGAICPNLSITPLKVNKKSIWFYVKEYMRLYCPKKRVGTSNDYDLESIIKVPSDNSGIAQKLNIDAPELQWNNPTLREVLNDLFMIVDCIPIVNADNELDFLDLTQTNQNISNDKDINYIERTQSSDDYVSEIYMNMQNVMQTSVPNVNNSVRTVEKYCLNANNYILTSENFLLKTRFPIQNINHLWMYNIVTVNAPVTTDSQLQLQKIDLCNLGGYSFVKEKQDYDSLKIYYRETGFPSTLEGKSNTQNCCIYFTRYTNEISGFQTETKNAKVLFFDTGISNSLFWLKELAKDYIPLPNTGSEGEYKYSASSLPTTEHSNSYPFTFFEIDYDTTSDSVFTASKNDTPNNQRVIIDNQSNSFVDAYTQGNLEYQKANRLGNPEMIISQRVKTDDSTARLIDIGDYFMEGNDKYIVHSVEYQDNKHHIEVRANATKDYILKNYFTGIKSKIRTWVNAKDEALIRHDLKKIYCEFSKDKYVTEINKENITIQNNILASPIFDKKVDYIKTALCRVDGNLPSNSTYYALETTSRVIGNSVVLTVGFTDNYNVEVSPDYEEIFPSKTYDKMVFGKDSAQYFPYFKDNELTVYGGGVPYQNRKYVDDNGNFQNISFDFRNEKEENKENNLNGFPNATIIDNTQYVGLRRKYIFKFDTNIDLNAYTNLVAQNRTAIRIVIDKETIIYATSGTDSTIGIYNVEGSPFYGKPYFIGSGEGYPPIDSRITVYPTMQDGEYTGETALKEMIYNSFRKPIVDDEDFGESKCALTLARLKDNKDITKQSIQFEYGCNTKDIFITKHFVRYHQFVKSLENNVKIYGSNTYTITDTLPQNAILINATIYESDNRYAISNTDYVAYYITCNDDLVMGVKGNSFYLSEKLINNDKIYNENNIIVDKL